MSPALDLRPILYVLGWLLTVLGIAMLVPMLVDLLLDHPDWTSFMAGGVITSFIGVSLVLTMGGRSIVLRRQQTFLLTTSAWVTTGIFGCLPFMLSEFEMSFPDAFFETISGLTTTGSTVMSGLDIAPPGILLWRSILQWLGGIGIIGMSLVIFPFLRIGGMQLFKTESSDTTEKILPSVGRLGAAISLVYLALSVICALAYWAAGMSAFDSLLHAMTTLSTGGYSNHDNSFAYFDEWAIHWVGIIFMTIGSLPFVLFISAVLGRPMKLFGDRQVTRFLGFLALCCLAVTVSLMITEDNIGFGEALTLASFNVVSIVSTTGYASADYSLWGGFVVVFVFLLMVVGGCTGSTTGGIKMFRLDIAVKLYGGYIRTLILPHAVNVPQYNGRPVTDELGRAVLLYIFLYLATATALSLALAVLGMPALEAASSGFSAVGNIGPGLGPVVGPVGNFSTIPDTAKWLMSFGMLLGRLEFFTVLILFSPNFWKA